MGALVLWKRLGHFLSILGEPVPLTVLALQLKLLLDDLVDLLFLRALEFADEIFKIFKSLHFEKQNLIWLLYGNAMNVYSI